MWEDINKNKKLETKNKTQESETEAPKRVWFLRNLRIPKLTKKANIYWEIVSAKWNGEKFWDKTKIDQKIKKELASIVTKMQIQSDSEIKANYLKTPSIKKIDLNISDGITINDKYINSLTVWVDIPISEIDKDYKNSDIRWDQEACKKIISDYLYYINSIDNGFLQWFDENDILSIVDKETLFGKFKSWTGSRWLMQITKRPILQIAQNIKNKNNQYKEIFEKVFPNMTLVEFEKKSLNNTWKSNDINSIKVWIIYLNFCNQNKVKYDNFSTYKWWVKDMIKKWHPEIKDFEQKWSEYISYLKTPEWSRIKNLVQTAAKYNWNNAKYPNTSYAFKYAYGLYVWFVRKFIHND